MYIFIHVCIESGTYISFHDVSLIHGIPCKLLWRMSTHYITVISKLQLYVIIVSGERKREREGEEAREGGREREREGGREKRRRR